MEGCPPNDGKMKERTPSLNGLSLSPEEKQCYLTIGPTLKTSCWVKKARHTQIHSAGFCCCERLIQSDPGRQKFPGGAVQQGPPTVHAVGPGPFKTGILESCRLQEGATCSPLLPWCLPQHLASSLQLPAHILSSCSSTEAPTGRCRKEGDWDHWGSCSVSSLCPLGSESQRAAQDEACFLSKPGPWNSDPNLLNKLRQLPQCLQIIEENKQDLPVSMETP